MLNLTTVEIVKQGNFTEPVQPTPFARELIGERIQDRRYELNIRRGDLSTAIGVSYEQMRKYERGIDRVSDYRLNKIADVLQCPVEYFREVPIPRSNMQDAAE